MTEAEFRNHIGLGHEQRGVEFKGPGPSSDVRLAAKVVRAILGMTNKRDGGVVIVGVEDTGTSLIEKGLSASDLPTWTHDIVSDKVAKHADSAVSLHGSHFRSQGKDYFVVEVKEFEDSPVLCSKACSVPSSRKGKPPEEILREGTLYVRSMSSPGTTSAPSHSELRDLLDLAVEKGVRRFLQLATRVGMPVPGVVGAPSSDEKFREQLGDLNV